MQYYAMCKHPTNPMAYNKASCVFAVGALVSCYTNNCVKVMCVCGHVLTTCMFMTTQAR